VPTRVAELLASYQDRASEVFLEAEARARQHKEADEVRVIAANERRRQMQNVGTRSSRRREGSDAARLLVLRAGDDSDDSDGLLPLKRPTAQKVCTLHTEH
jgi:hypothetical protein